MTDSSSSKRIDWIDYARAISIILIIIAHTHYLSISTVFGGIPSQQTHILFSAIGISPYFHYANKIFYEILSTFRLPLLFLLSGIVYSLSRKKRTISELTRNKFRRLIIPFIFTTLFLSVPIKYLCGYFDESTNLIHDIVCGHMLLMGNSHLWFLVTLFVIFITSHIIDRILKSIAINAFASQSIIILIGAFMFILSGRMPEILATDRLFYYFIFFSIGASRVTFSLIEKINPPKNHPWLTVGGYWIIFTILVISYRRFVSHLGIDTHSNTILILEGVLCIIWGLAGAYGSILLAKVISSSKKLSKNRAFSFVKDNSFKLYRYSDPFNYLVIYISTSTGLLLIDHPIGAPVHCMTRLIVTMTAPLVIILAQVYLKNNIARIINRTYFAFSPKRNSSGTK